MQQMQIHDNANSFTVAPGTVEGKYCAKEDKGCEQDAAIARCKVALTRLKLPSQTLLVSKFTR